MKELNIRHQKPVFIIAEVGVNHNGDIRIAKELIDAGNGAMADAIKFQTWKTDNIAIRSSEKALYQKEAPGDDGTQYEMLKKLELNYEAFFELNKYASERGVLFISTPDDEESADFLVHIGVPFFKIGSGEITNLAFLRHVAVKGKPIIISTGMSSLGEVEKAVAVIKDAQAEVETGELVLGNFVIPPLTLLHCVSSYPSPAEDSNLKVIPIMSAAFGLPVGYSDHSEDIAVTLAAVALGATIIERHFTLDRNMQGPDHRSSIEPLAFRKMVKSIRTVEMALGDGIKRPMPSENGIKPVVRKTLVAACDISKEINITPMMIAAKRAGIGISAEFMHMVVGKKTLRDITKDEVLEWEMFS